MTLKFVVTAWTGTGHRAQSSSSTRPRRQEQQQQQASSQGAWPSASLGQSAAVSTSRESQSTPFMAPAVQGKQPADAHLVGRPSSHVPDLISFADASEELSYGRSSELSHNSGLPSLTLTDEEAAMLAANKQGAGHQQQQQANGLLVQTGNPFAPATVAAAAATAEAVATAAAVSSAAAPGLAGMEYSQHLMQQPSYQQYPPGMIYSQGQTPGMLYSTQSQPPFPGSYAQQQQQLMMQHHYSVQQQQANHQQQQQQAQQQMLIAAGGLQQQMTGLALGAAAAGVGQSNGNPAGPVSSAAPPATSSPQANVFSSSASPWQIDPSEISLGPRIGIGSYGEVYKGTWRGTEVAVKRILEQNISPQLMKEFIDEVELMARLRHPNIVLFMGAVTQVREQNAQT